MKKEFSVFNFLFEQELGENGEEEDPNQAPPEGDPVEGEDPQAMAPAPMPQAPQQPQGVAQQMPKPAPVSSDNFSRLIGRTISNITFEGVGENGGKIMIQTSDSHIPVEIGWVNNQITVSDPSKLQAPVKPMKKK